MAPLIGLCLLLAPHPSATVDPEGWAAQFPDSSGEERRGMLEAIGVDGFTAGLAERAQVDTLEIRDVELGGPDGDETLLLIQVSGTDDDGGAIALSVVQAFVRVGDVWRLGSPEAWTAEWDGMARPASHSGRVPSTPLTVELVELVAPGVFALRMRATGGDTSLGQTSVEVGFLALQGERLESVFGPFEVFGRRFSGDSMLQARRADGSVRVVGDGWPKAIVTRRRETILRADEPKPSRSASHQRWTLRDGHYAPDPE